MKCRLAAAAAAGCCRCRYVTRPYLVRRQVVYNCRTATQRYSYSRPPRQTDSAALCLSLLFAALTHSLAPPWHVTPWPEAKSPYDYQQRPVGDRTAATAAYMYSQQWSDGVVRLVNCCCCRCRLLLLQLPMPSPDKKSGT